MYLKKGLRFFMSSNKPYITLYRQYKTKVSEELKDSIVERYKKNSLSLLPINDKTTSVEVPEIMKVLDFHLNNADNNPSENYKYIMKDGTCLDKLLTFDFSSAFTCISDYFYLDPYIPTKSTMIIDSDLAYKMQVACNYLLSKNWSDEIENILDNPWINIIAEDNQLMLFDYHFRNNKDYKMCAEDKECLNEMKRNIKALKLALDIYLSDIYSYDNSNLLLVYSA